MSRPHSGGVRSIRPQRVLMSLWLAVTSACAGTVSGEEEPRSLLRDDGAPMQADAPPSVVGQSAASKKSKNKAQASDACSDRALEVEAMFEQRCASCHGPGKSQGGFGDILDRDRLVAQGKIVPRDP